jgi:hypothetical protein
VDRYVQDMGVSRAEAVLCCLLSQLPNPCQDTKTVLALCRGELTPEQAPIWLVEFARQAMGARL